MNPEIAFGQVLRELRISKSITQEKLAFEAELDRTFISLLERGQRQPTLSTIFQLSKALQISPEKIIAQVSQRIHFNLANDENEVNHETT